MRWLASAVLAAFLWCTGASCFAKPCPTPPACPKSKTAPQPKSVSCDLLPTDPREPDPDLVPAGEAPPVAPVPTPPLASATAPIRDRGSGGRELLQFLHILRI